MATLRLSRGLGFILLGVMLILMGCNQLFGLHFNGFNIVTGVLALVSGIIFIIER